jgi:hypothetical protein
LSTTNGLDTQILARVSTRLKLMQPLRIPTLGRAHFRPATMLAESRWIEIRREMQLLKA